jgi:hypothetical protein
MLVLGAAMAGALAMVMIRQNKSMGALLFAQYVLEQPRLLPAPDPSAAAPLLSREGVRQSRRGDAGGPGRPFAAAVVGSVRDLVLVVSEFTFVLALLLIGLAIEAATGRAAFLGFVLLAQAALQVAVLGAIIVINRSFNLVTEARRLDGIVRRRGQEPRGESG